VHFWSTKAKTWVECRDCRAVRTAYVGDCIACVAMVNNRQYARTCVAYTERHGGCCGCSQRSSSSSSLTGNVKRLLALPSLVFMTHPIVNRLLMETRFSRGLPVNQETRRRLLGLLSYSDVTARSRVHSALAYGSLLLPILSCYKTIK